MGAYGLLLLKAGPTIPQSFLELFELVWRREVDAEGGGEDSLVLVTGHKLKQNVIRARTLCESFDEQTASWTNLHTILCIELILRICYMLSQVSKTIHQKTVAL